MCISFRAGRYWSMRDDDSVIRRGEVKNGFLITPDYIDLNRSRSLDAGIMPSAGRSPGRILPHGLVPGCIVRVCERSRGIRSPRSSWSWKPAGRASRAVNDPGGSRFSSQALSLPRRALLLKEAATEIDSIQVRRCAEFVARSSDERARRTRVWKYPLENVRRNAP